MASFAKQIEIDVPRQVVWQTLADIGSIHEWNPSVVDSRSMTPGTIGPGSARRCDLGGRNYLEEAVVEWHPMETLTMRITATNLPFKAADIRFSLLDQGPSTLVTVSPTYELKFGWLGRLLDSVLVRSQYEKGMEALLKGLKAHVENASRAANG